MKVSDGWGGETSQVFHLQAGTGLPNNSPTFKGSIPIVNATVGSFFSYSIVEETFTDPDGDELLYTLSLNNGEAFPDWISFDPTIPAISGVPTTDGEINLKIKAQDDRGGSTEGAVSLAISPLADTTTGRVWTAIIIVSVVVLVIVIILLTMCLLKCRKKTLKEDSDVDSSEEEDII